ncbi:MAG: hypothetical protein J0I08_15000, partial [Rhizobiales bacterium]|nr:hypothetical protein [Hyphomicrobiales bacterium]
AQIGDRNPGLLFLQYSDDLVFGEPVALHLWSLSWGQSLLHTGSSQGGNVKGNSNKGIARKIDIAEATVKVHVKAILRKIRVQNRTQAAIWGMNNVLPVQPANSNSLLPAVDASESFSNSTALVPR